MKQLLLLLDSGLRRWMPDPFVIAIILTALTYVLAVVCMSRSDDLAIGQPLVAVVEMWEVGFGIWQHLRCRWP